MYQVLELPDVFTTEQSGSLFWFAFAKQITLTDLKEKNRDHPTIAIFLTASVSDQNLQVFNNLILFKMRILITYVCNSNLKKGNIKFYTFILNTFFILLL